MAELSRASLATLPPELLSHVCSELDQRDLSQAAALCRTISPAAVRQLYRYPRIVGAAGWQSLYATVVSNRTLRCLVRRLRWRRAVLRPLSTDDEVEGVANAWGIDSLRGFFPECKRLTIHLDDPMAQIYDLDDIVFFVALVCPVVIDLGIASLDDTWMTSNRLSNIETLRLTKYYVDPDSTPSLLRCFGQLRQLEIALGRGYFTGEEIAAIYEIGNSLERLSLTCCDDRALDVEHIECLGRELPSLTSLELKVYGIDIDIFKHPFCNLLHLEVTLYSNDWEDCEPFLTALRVAALQGRLPVLRSLHFLEWQFSEERMRADSKFCDLVGWAERAEVTFWYRRRRA